MNKIYTFEAEIQSGDGGGAYIIFPFDVQKEFGVRGRVPVTTTIDGEPYRGSLIKYGSPEHMLPVLKDVRAKIGKSVGDTVAISLKLDTTERTIDIAADFKKALKVAKIEADFEKMSFTHRKEYNIWIESAKKPETRATRIEKAVVMIRDKKKLS
jgi:hypothetical protein